MGYSYEKKFISPSIVVFACIATSFMASASSSSFTVHLPSWGNDVNCKTLAKSTDEQEGLVTPLAGTDNANYWIVDSSGNRLSETMYIEKQNAGSPFTLAYKPGMSAYSGDSVTLRADGAAPWSGTAKGIFDAK